MKTTVTQIKLGLTNEHRFPFATAQLACGHGAACELRPMRAKCYSCGNALEAVGHVLPKCACGHYSATEMDLPNAHNAADQITKIGDVVDCERCDWQAKGLAELKMLIASGTLSHSRWRNGSVHGYRYEPTSPTGVLIAVTLDETPEALALLRGGLSPLSPTEPR